MRVVEGIVGAEGGLHGEGREGGESAGVGAEFCEVVVCGGEVEVVEVDRVFGFKAVGGTVVPLGGGDGCC